MRTYPLTTTNYNVPKDVFLVAETEQMSGEITITYYIDLAGNIRKVTDWVDNTPQPAYMFELCRLTLDREQTITHKWEAWKRYK